MLYRFIKACLVAAAWMFAPANASAASKADWNTDLTQLVDKVILKHPDPFAKTGRLTFLRAAQTLRQRIPTRSDEENMVAMMKLFSSIGDGHSLLEPDNPAFAYWYPVRIMEYPDGYFITTAMRDVRALAGARVLMIAGRPVDEVAAQARSLMGADNSFNARENLTAMHNGALMRGLGYAGKDRALTVTVRLKSGRTITQTLPALKTISPLYKTDDSTLEWRFRPETMGPPLGKPADWISAYNGLSAEAFRTPDTTRPLHLTLRRALIARAIPAQNAYYIQANHVNDAADESFDAFFDRALAEMDRQKPRRVIIDLRFNPGGDGSRVPGLIGKFQRHAERQGNPDIYVLTSGKTFSAAIMLADAFVDNLGATIVGEPMGAPLNFYGDTAEIPLQRIGAMLHLSTVRHQLSDFGDVAELSPVDIPAPMLFSDWIAGRDPAVDPILSGNEMRSLARIVQSDGATAVRTAFAARQQRFGSYAWWTPPAEIELRRPTRSLTEAKRLTDAIAIGEINTLLHPDIWNTWYNLAHAQQAAGQISAAQASFRRVLEIDPNNDNGDEIQQALAAKTIAAFAQPEMLRWGSTVEEMEAVLVGRCATMKTREINPPFLETVKAKQVQIDCDGFAYLGSNRRVEFVFRDGSLEMAWVMFDPTEQDRTLAAMRADFGVPGDTTANYVAFPANRTAWRFRPAEILFYSPALAGEVEKWF